MSAMDTPKEYIRASEVARLLHVSPKTVGRWARNDLLPYTITLGGQRIYHRPAIERIAHRLARGEEPAA